MRRLAWTFAALVASFALYLGVFSIVERPLTLNDIGHQLDAKLAYASSLPSPKLMIFAGSNGRYSHRCSVFTEILEVPCVNGAIASGIGLDVLLEQYAPTLRRGDMVYMPLEYEQYAVSEAEMHEGIQNAVLLRNRPAALQALPASRIAQTYGAFDLPFLVRGVVEMGLARANFKRRTGVDTLTPQGDEAGHTAERGKPYQAYLRQATLPRTTVPPDSFAQSVLRKFLADAREKGVVVIGGLPTIPEQTRVDDADVQRIRALFEQAGHRFVVLESQSRYPLEALYDVPYHLNEEAQVRHSRAVALLLQQLKSRPAGR